jgi:hypothetical protein
MVWLQFGDDVTADVRRELQSRSCSALSFYKYR